MIKKSVFIVSIQIYLNAFYVYKIFNAEFHTCARVKSPIYINDFDLKFNKKDLELFWK